MFLRKNIRLLILLVAVAFAFFAATNVEVIGQYFGGTPQRKFALYRHNLKGLPVSLILLWFGKPYKEFSDGSLLYVFELVAIDRPSYYGRSDFVGIKLQARGGLISI